MDPSGIDAVALLRAQAHIWRCILGMANAMSLKCVIQLGIPEIILSHGRSITLSELTSQLPVNHGKSSHVGRLMRLLAHSGFFDLREQGGEQVYSLNLVSKLLLKEDPASMSPAVLSVLEPVSTTPWQSLTAWFQNDKSTVFRTTHGIEFWECLGRDSRLNDLFNEALAGDTRLISRVLIDKAGEGIFEGMDTLVDVGGGAGAMACAIVDHFPRINCAVLDLPHVVTGLSRSTNPRFVPGDMFEEIPPADGILLKSILHNWGDEDSVKILKRCKEAIMKSSHAGKKVLIIDVVIGSSKDEGTMTTATQLAFDTMMMVLFAGKERTETEWAKLFVEAGFKDYKITPVLGWRSLIEVYP